MLFFLLKRITLICTVTEAGNQLKTKEGHIIMEKYVCDVCGYIYDPEVGDPENGIEPGTEFSEMPEDWVCPECGAGRSEFSPL